MTSPIPGDASRLLHQERHWEDDNVAAHVPHECATLSHAHVWEEIGTFNRCVAGADSVTSTLHAQRDTFERSRAYCPDVK